MPDLFQHVGWDRAQKPGCMVWRGAENSCTMHVQKTQLMGRKDDKNNKTLHMPTIVPTEGSRSSGETSSSGPSLASAGETQPRDPELFLLPSNVVYFTVCGVGTASAEPRCSKIVYMMSYS